MKHAPPFIRVTSTPQRMPDDKSAKLFDSLVSGPSVAELAKKARKTRPAFENTPCERCAGTGQYKPRVNCFACGGTGWKFTKRGKAAQVFMIDLMRTTGKKVGPAMRAALNYQATLTTRGRVKNPEQPTTEAKP